ncbi:DUF4625 domain-containing protein [Pontibacter locisalis]|uniref:DUF4625 domain-containing protein n=1 Tax=Pontibacter locisalis TaxID=1719035 RepID=A0ABW5IIS3_9BACT
MKKLNWFFLVLFSFVAFACDDDDDVELDTTNPSITITSPAAGSTFGPGTVIPLRATVTDNIGLDEIRVNVTDPSGTTRQVDDQSINDFLNDNREKDLDVDIILDANAPAGAYSIAVVAIDEQGNQATQSVNVSVMQ